MAQVEEFLLGGEQVSSEVELRRLAIEIFRRALADLRCPQLNEQHSALHFLLKDEANFSFWCEQLDLDPKTFRQRLRKNALAPWEGLPSFFTELL